MGLTQIGLVEIDPNLIDPNPRGRGLKTAQETAAFTLQNFEP